MAGEQVTNQSVERAASLLAAFSGARPLRVADLATRAGLGQSTASRLLATLEALQYVERDEAGAYRLGAELIGLTGAALNQHPVFLAGRQPVQRLAGQVGLGANLAVLRDWSVFYLANFEGVDASRPVTLTGTRNPLHSTGMGKCLLLGSTPAARREALPMLRAFTRHTIVEHRRLDEELDLARERGYATEVEELAFGRACVAAPIRDGQGRVVAAVSISGPLSTIDLTARERALSIGVIETADLISTGLGYTGHAEVPVPERSLT